MIQQALVLALLLIASAVLSSSQRRRPGGMYGWLQLTLLMVGIYGLREGSDQVALIVITLCGLTVVVPSILDQVAKAAFARGRTVAAVRFFSWRATLMPGAGLSRQQEILYALELYDAQGADAAVSYLAELEAAATEESVRAVICEQRVAILFQAGRWEEGIHYYNQAFHPNYAALRPALALGLLRAYGESGDLERASAILRLLEESALANDPRAKGLLGQAQLTYLAYAGASRWVERFIKEGATGKIGISRAGDELYRGIARARSGDLSAAKAAFGRVQEVATAKDFQVLNAAQRSLTGLEAEEREHPLATLAEETGDRVEQVAARVQALFASGLELRVSRWPFASMMMVGLLLLGYAAFAWSGGGVTGLASTGALVWYATPTGAAPELWLVLTHPWVHGDPIIMALNGYAIWSSGRILESRWGGVVFAAITVFGGLLGTAVALIMVNSTPVTLWGAGFMALSAVGASLPAGGQLARRTGVKGSRRWYVIIGMFASGLSLSVVGLIGWSSGLLGAAVAFGAGLSASLWLRRGPRSRGHRWLAGGAVATVAVATVAGIFAAAEVTTTAAEEMGPPCTYEGVYFSTGLGAFQARDSEVDVFALPSAKDALVDDLALRTGNFVQITVLPGTTARAALERGERGKNPAIFGSWIEGFDERFTVKRRTVPRARSTTDDSLAGDPEGASIWEIYRGGDVIAEAWLRRAGPGGPIVGLLGAPFGALSGVDRHRYVRVVGADVPASSLAAPACVVAERP